MASPIGFYFESFSLTFQVDWLFSAFTILGFWTLNYFGQNYKSGARVSSC